VVSGDVGCGKTSLLQSETLRLLKSEKFAPILLTRSHITDAKKIKDVCDVIEAAVTQNQKLQNPVLVVDQTEEIFARFPGREARETLGQLFGQLIRHRACKILCAIRKDYFLDLYDLGATMGIEVRPTLMLNNFSPDEAKDVIVECAAEEGLSFTDELIGKIVDDLTKESQIRPPELQIVCTALTANFSLRHYNELGGAKGILQSYLTLTLETCIDPRLARLILRQMCDFERQAKAEPKTADELTKAIGPRPDDFGPTSRLVQLVVDHLVRSRLALIVGGRASLIHDYWVSVIRDFTAHDRSEQEKADELLRRHLCELEAGFSSTLNSKQLRIIRRFASRDLLGTQGATRLLRRSTHRVWVSRGVAVGGLVTLFAVGWWSSAVVWDKAILVDPSTARPVSRYFLSNTGRLVVTPGRHFAGKERSKISVWNFRNAKRLLEFDVDSWFPSPKGDAVLYSDGGREYVADLNQLTRTTFPQPFDGSAYIKWSESARCALYSSHTGAEKMVNGVPGLTRLLLWSVPEGKLLGSADVQARSINEVFVSDRCDRAVFKSVEISSLRESESGTSMEWKGRPWIWDINAGPPRPLIAHAANLSVSVDEEANAVVTVETEHSSAVKLWDLRTGLREPKQPFELQLAPHIWDFVRFGPGGRYIVTVSSGWTDDETTGDEIRVVGATNLQETPFTKGHHLIECQVAQSANSTGSFLWSVPGQGGYIWDASGTDPSPLKNFKAENIVGCTVSSDRSHLIVLRKGGSVELWSIAGEKVQSLVQRGAMTVGWTLEGTTIQIEQDNGELLLLGSNGSLLARLPGPGDRRKFESNYGVVQISSREDSPTISYQPLCRQAMLWAIDGRFIKYSKALRVFDLPYSIPFFWSRPVPECEN
jgi:WD40 repeat protein